MVATIYTDICQIIAKIIKRGIAKKNKGNKKNQTMVS